MKIPLRLSLLSLPLALALSASEAQALTANMTYDIHIDGLPVGSLRFRSRVVENGQLYCQYTGMWTNLSKGLTRTRSCKINEYKAGDQFDCEENRRGFFSTAITGALSGCNGFDYFGQATHLNLLIAGESPDGYFNGVVIQDSIGDVEPFEMGPRRPAVIMPPPPDQKVIILE